jgi:hypothetical protein
MLPGSVITLTDNLDDLEALTASYSQTCEGSLPLIDVVAVAQRLAPLYGCAAHLEFSASRTSFRFRAAQEGATAQAPGALGVCRARRSYS